uniref:Uncharacterized protein n=1 Tax=Siphoviridae sp. ct87j35 TaxID=2825356 RepID=A0A8S5V4J9_9CAUD|nr:MAG TPA: hypothetical protein [Siphoviridae sp. ct87j35]
MYLIFPSYTNKLSNFCTEMFNYKLMNASHIMISF